MLHLLGIYPHDNDNDDSNEHDKHKELHITYITPGKRRRTTTLTRWNPHALRRMRQRLGEEHEHNMTSRDRNGGDSSVEHGNTRDSENDVTRVGVT